MFCLTWIMSNKTINKSCLPDPSVISKVTNKNELWITVELISVQMAQLLQSISVFFKFVCLWLIIFVLAVFLIFSFHVLTVYVYLSLSLMAVNYHCLKFVKSWRSSINTVVNFWQSFIEKLGLQETGNKQTNVLLVTWYFIFIALHAWLWIVIVGSGRSTQNKMGKRNVDYQNIEKEVRDGTVGGYM